MERVVGYFSKTLDAREKRLSATEGECATIIWAVNKVRPYIIGNHFYIQQCSKVNYISHALCKSPKFFF